MTRNRNVSLAASALPVMGIVLALANWNARPDRLRAWTAAVVMFLVMIGVRRYFLLAFRRSSKVAESMKRALNAFKQAHEHGDDQDAVARQDAQIVKVALGRTVATVNNGVIVGALLMIIPLAMTLANAYGFVNDPASGNRAVMIIAGAYLVVIGNAMPRSLPPVSSMRHHSARIQAFQRSVGWTWVLCGLGFVMAWLALPVNAARPVSMTLVGAAMVITVLQILRLARTVRRRVPA